MKNILALFICMIIFSCSSSPDAEIAKGDACTQYACPMHPDKTSANPEECPECRMKMVPVKDEQKNDTAKERTSD